jgi:Mg2+ and Co2+ transporter CorA
VTDSATFATPEADDEETGEDPGGLDDLLASLRTMIKALLKRYKYPPDQEAAAIDLVLRQAETLSEDLTEAMA